MNEHKYTNNLINETSPYLLQHAHNPVNWYAWNDEALQKAKAEDKPILVSIGYSACHWCHVMERESFEDAETAQMMNTYFINIKIDREERPDIDHIYMDAVQAFKSIELAKQLGFENISIDLIYGTPNLSDEGWIQNLETARQLNVPHLSCYALTIEPNTALQKMIAQHKKENVDAEKQGRQFEVLMQWANENGYEHYEISNFAKPGFRSKHNSSYWQGKPYLGLGPSAHSYNGISRQWNIANNALYIKSIRENIIPSEKEDLTSTQKLNEYIMTGLRTTEGISLTRLYNLSSQKVITDIINDAQKFMQQNLIERKNGSLILTQKGKLFADGIAADLFRV